MLEYVLMHSFHMRLQWLGIAEAFDSDIALAVSSSLMHDSYNFNQWRAYEECRRAKVARVVPSLFVYHSHAGPQVAFPTKGRLAKSALMLSPVLMGRSSIHTVHTGVPLSSHGLSSHASSSCRSGWRLYRTADTDGPSSSHGLFWCATLASVVQQMLYHTAHICGLVYFREPL